MWTERFKPALGAGLTHLTGSVVLALLVAALVFGVWYPPPYDQLVGGRELFLLLMSVDVVCGPLLTFVVYNPKKPKSELLRDIGVIIVVQLGALSYGVFTMAQARPVFLAFERDSFRVVCAIDVDESALSQVAPTLRPLSLTGPQLIGVHLPSTADGDFVQSTLLAIQGQHPAFDPKRWLDYSIQRQEVISKAKPLVPVREKHPELRKLIDEAVKNAKIPVDALGYVPVVAKKKVSDWVVLIGLADGLPKGFLPIDGWQ